MSFKDKFKNLFNTEEYEYVEEYEETVDQPSIESNNKNENQDNYTDKNIVNLATIQQSTSRVILTEPHSYNEVQQIADHLLNKRSVIINLQQLDKVQAKRIIDFLSGTVYAIKGEIQKLGISTFICTPDNVQITGEITNLDYMDEL